GPVLLPFWVGIHLVFVARFPTAKFIFLAALAAMGWVVDSALIQFGLFTLPNNASFAPLWLVSMWVVLVLTSESLLRWRKNLLLFMAIGAVSGPLAYVWCEAVEIMNYARPLPLSLALHGVIWALLTPTLFYWRDFVYGRAPE